MIVHERSATVRWSAIIAHDSLAHVDAVRAGLIALARAGQFQPAGSAISSMRIRRADDWSEAVAAAAGQALPPADRPAGTDRSRRRPCQIAFSVIPALPPGRQ
jgi:hypothetical protein